MAESLRFLEEGSSAPGRLQALDWLNHSEGLDRGWYSGPLGWLGRDDDATFVVALRSALLEGERGFAYAGCGLVPGSTPEGEWFETLEKLRAVRGALCVSPERGA